MVGNFRRISDFDAAGIIDRAFPKHPVFTKVDTTINIFNLIEALQYARNQCGSGQLDRVIEWSRKVIYGKK